MLYDGQCAFCSGAANFALGHGRRSDLRFASLQSDVGQLFLRHYGLPTSNFKTFVIVREGRAYTRFEAAVQLGYLIGGWWALLATLLDFTVPDFVGNPVYSLLWPLRKIFGSLDECAVPTPQMRQRLIEVEIVLPPAPELELHRSP